jgi:hypothetical protein
VPDLHEYAIRRDVVTNTPYDRHLSDNLR